MARQLPRRREAKSDISENADWDFELMSAQNIITNKIHTANRVLFDKYFRCQKERKKYQEIQRNVRVCWYLTVIRGSHTPQRVPFGEAACASSR